MHDWVLAKLGYDMLGWDGVDGVGWDGTEYWRCMGNLSCAFAFVCYGVMDGDEMG